MGPSFWEWPELVLGFPEVVAVLPTLVEVRQTVISLDQNGEENSWADRECEATSAGCTGKGVLHLQAVTDLSLAGDT